MQTQVLGLSVDSQPCLKAWAESLGGITYPLLSDFYPHGKVAKRYGVLRREGHSERALFVIDKRGVIRYVDVHDIDEKPDNEVLFAALAEADPEAAAAYAPPPPEAGPEPDAAVVMYCTSWCPSCKRVRQFLKNHAIAYTEIDIERDRRSAKRVREWTGGSETTPTFNIRGEIIVEFDQPRLEQVLGIKV